MNDPVAAVITHAAIGDASRKATAQSALHFAESLAAENLRLEIPNKAPSWPRRWSRRKRKLETARWHAKNTPIKRYYEHLASSHFAAAVAYTAVAGTFVTVEAMGCRGEVVYDGGSPRERSGFVIADDEKR